MTTFAAQIAEFESAGNTVIGNAPRVTSTFELFWIGKGNTLIIGNNCTFAQVRIRFEGGGGTVSLGENVMLKGFFVVSDGSRLSIGADTFLNRPCDLRAKEGANLDIGERCLFSNVRANTSDLHSVLDVQSGARANPAQGIAIEDEVWLAEDVRVSKGARIGFGSIVGAGSIVTRPIAPMCLAVGRPARIVKTGVTWSRSLMPVASMPAREFLPNDIPFDKAVIRQLVVSKQFRLVIDVIMQQLDNGYSIATLPDFAKWYLVQSRHRLKVSVPQDLHLLDNLIQTMPNHTAAQELREELARQFPL